jgi:ligand-binding sensor domain-containing protein/class 3 adenylate cyclase
MRSLLAVPVILCATALSAQRFYFEHLSVPEGLPASKVYTMLQDRSGLVWLGTEAGLVSYDGINVTTLGSAQGVAQNGVRSLMIDREQRLWAGHNGGGISIGQGAHFHMLAIEGDPLTTDITGMAQDAEGRVWIATVGQGVLRIDDASGTEAVKATRFGQAQGILEHVIGLSLLRDGTLAFIEDGGTLKKWDKAGDRFSLLEWQGLQDVQQITAVYQDGQDRIWLGTLTSGAYVLDRKSGQVVNYDQGNGLPSNLVSCFGEDPSGQVWVGMWDGGVAVMGLKGVRRRFNPESGLPSLSIRRFANDREGNMLIATNDNGLAIFKGERFLNFIDEDGLLDPQVWTVMEDRTGRIWFGTNGGISVLDPHTTGTGLVKTISVQQGKLTSNRVRSLREDAKGNIWIGTETGGIIELDPQAYQPFEHDELSAVIPEGKVTAMETGQPGELWFGTLNGLKRYSPGVPPTAYTEDDGIPATIISALYRDEKGTIWVGIASHGIGRVDNGIARQIDIQRTFTPNCFIQDADGRLWVGTEGQGIVLLKDGREVQNFTVDDGLLSNTIRSMARDKEGHIWIGTTKGLNKWAPNKEGFLAFTQRSGFVGIEAKPNAVCVTQNGDIWFGTNGGATRITPEKEAEQSLPPIVAIRSWTVNLEDRDLEQGVHLSHTERSIRIAFGSVSLSDPAAVRYQYMLDGLDADWQPVTYESDAYYPALPPGGYSFTVKAMNRAGLWSEPAVFRFSILPPWYRSWWFYTTLVIFLGVVLFSYIKVRERRLRQQNLILEQKVVQRTAEVVRQSGEIAKQKDQIEDLLLNILPGEVADELKEKGKASPRKHDNVTVLFTDMKGFTRIAEKMTPEELVNDLDDCFIRFDAIVDKYGIEKIKTIGDSYMCAGGVPTNDPWHAQKAVLAALEIRELMDLMAVEQRNAVREPWVVRIGVHTGPVVAGVVGKRKFAYDIWGDAVNTASRMESSGEPGEVNVSGATYALVKDHFDCEYRGKVQAKNKGEIDMYFVKRIKAEFASDQRGSIPNQRFLRAIGLEKMVAA